MSDHETEGNWLMEMIEVYRSKERQAEEMEMWRDVILASRTDTDIAAIIEEARVLYMLAQGLIDYSR
jgi:hypothetical protein